MTPRSLFRTLPLAETVTWTLLLLGMVLKYATGTTDVVVRLGGGLHGFVFLAYVATTVLVGVDRPWSPRRIVAGLASAVVPYLTIPFERLTERAGVLGSSWRLLSSEPRTLPERAVAWALRKPLVSGAVVLVGLVVVFGGLLAAGPPTQWGS